MALRKGVSGYKGAERGTMSGLPGDDALERLRLLPLELEAEALEPLTLPAFSGSTLRGAFGRALKDAVCVVAHGICEACPVHRECAYPYVFETVPGEQASRLRKATFVPHPYVVRAPEGDGPLAVGTTFRLGVTLIGRAVERAPAVVQALFRMGERGLTGSRSRFAVREVVAWRGNGAPPLPVAVGDPPRMLAGHAAGVTSIGAFRPDVGVAGITVRFVTPARLAWQGVPVGDVPFHVLARNLLRRASNLLALHEGIELEVDFRRAIADAEAVRVVESRLARADRVRYSARQDRIMNLHGVHGRVLYAGDVGPFRRLLALGQAVGVGKGTTFGLGRIEVAPLREATGDGRHETDESPGGLVPHDRPPGPAG